VFASSATSVPGWKKGSLSGGTTTHTEMSSRPSRFWSAHSIKPLLLFANMLEMGAAEIRERVSRQDAVVHLRACMASANVQKLHS
jgi:hypothetical protein